jgi:GTP-binding protein HflX
MLHETKTRSSIEKVILAGILTAGQDPALFEEDLQEMALLCSTAGARIAKTVIQKRPAPDATTFIGQGKLREISDAMRELGCSTLIIDAELSPGQVRNIEKIINGKVIDRSQLILDIFATHARTNEARIQVELAQLRTLYPRLTHAWTHFSQQVGGIGTRGPGEKQLEVDRRLIQKKVSDLKARLDKIEKSRQTQRKSRGETFKAALVGYTNVGKSSLLNALSGSKVLVENKLFATLDTATRRTFIPGVGTVVISDTVGFLRKLPHHLVASFRSTLEVVHTAELLLVVMDASSLWTKAQLETVSQVLIELDAQDVPRLLIFNKSDLLTDPFMRKQLELAYPGSIFVCAFKADDIARLKERIADLVRDRQREKSIAEIIKRKTNDAAQTY